MKDVIVPKKWGMYSSLGNLRIRKAAERFASKVLSKRDTVERFAAAKAFFLACQKLQYHKNFSEAGDTDVRDQIRAFAEELLPHTDGALQHIWEEAGVEAWRWYRALRQKRDNPPEPAGAPAPTWE